MQLVAISLFALGIAMLLFEGLVANNRAKFVPSCPAYIHCDYLSVPTEVYFGLFPAIAGAILLGIHKATRRRMALGAPQR